MILLIQAAAVWLMTGVTWTLQLLNYPLLKKIAPGNIGEYQAAHNRSFGKVMAPGVFVTAITTILLFFIRPENISLWAPISQFILLMLITGSAAISTAPAHRKLEQGFDANAINSLIIMNRFRLIIWIVFSVLDIYLLATGYAVR